MKVNETSPVVILDRTTYGGSKEEIFYPDENYGIIFFEGGELAEIEGTGGFIEIKIWENEDLFRFLCYLLNGNEKSFFLPSEERQIEVRYFSNTSLAKTNKPEPFERDTYGKYFNSFLRGYIEGFKSYQNYLDKAIEPLAKTDELIKTKTLEMAVINRPYQIDFQDKKFGVVSLLGMSANGFRQGLYARIKEVIIKHKWEENPTPDIEINPTSYAQKILFLQELGIIDFINKHWDLKGNSTRLGQIFANIIDVKADTIRKNIDGLRQNNKNDPKKSTDNINWLNESFNKLGLDKKKESPE